jgi:hypothetical protein
MNWRKISTISVWTAGLVAIIHMFGSKYLPKYPLMYMIPEGVGLIIFVVSETMNLITRRSSNKKV